MWNDNDNNNNEFTHTWTKCEKLHLSFLSLSTCLCVRVCSRECSKIAHSRNVFRSMLKAYKKLFHSYDYTKSSLSHSYIDYYYAECGNAECERRWEWRSYHRHEHFHYETITRTGKCDASKGKLIKDKHTLTHIRARIHMRAFTLYARRWDEIRWEVSGCEYECYLSSRSWNNNGSAKQMGCEDWRWFYVHESVYPKCNVLYDLMNSLRTPAHTPTPKNVLARMHAIDTPKQK